jgi:hypothetical protein
MNNEALITIVVNYLILLFLYLIKKVFPENSYINRAIKVNFFLSVLINFLSLSFGILSPFGLIIIDNNLLNFKNKINMYFHLNFTILIHITAFIIIAALSI